MAACVAAKVAAVHHARRNSGKVRRGQTLDSAVLTDFDSATPQLRKSVSLNTGGSVKGARSAKLDRLRTLLVDLENTPDDDDARPRARTHSLTAGMVRQNGSSWRERPDIPPLFDRSRSTAPSLESIPQSPRAPLEAGSAQLRSAAPSSKGGAETGATISRDMTCVSLAPHEPLRYNRQSVAERREYIFGEDSRRRGAAAGEHWVPSLLVRAGRSHDPNRALPRRC
jgi:hypothetical protein